jgi:hypothetical protein
MPTNYQTIEYTDELLADKTVCRKYNNGRIEWRTRIDETKIDWRDNQANFGVDELLGNGIIKRTYGNQTVYAREQGYGRTLWSNNLLTINRTSFGGKVGAILAGIGGAFLLGSLVAPPLMLGAQEEEELRRQQALQQQNSNSSSSDGGGWDDGDFSDSDGDFG